MIQSTLHGVVEPPKRTLLYRGAEADVVKGDWCGLMAVYKVRKRLPYRHPSLDAEIRRQRTVREAEMLRGAKSAGVSAPFLYFVDISHTTLVMEYVEGFRMKDLVASSPSLAPELFELLGEDVARLHSRGIMHGDLTTANVVVRRGDLVFLDFGLSVASRRLEDHAVDLRLIKETIVGAHSSLSRDAVRSLTEGYEKVAGSGRTRQVFRQLKSIERRGRYARVD